MGIGFSPLTGILLIWPIDGAVFDERLIPFQSPDGDSFDLAKAALVRLEAEEVMFQSPDGDSFDLARASR